MRYEPISREFYVQTRQLFMEKMEKGTCAVFLSNDIMPRSGDTFYRFRQNSDLFYLTGIDQEDTILLLYPDTRNENLREVLFIRETNEEIALWEGERLDKEAAKRISGVETVYWTTDFERIFHQIMLQTEGIYLAINEHNRYSSPLPYHQLRFARKVRKEYPMHRFYRAAPVLYRMRMVKSPEEIAQIKRAVAITRKAFIRSLEIIAPGKREFEIEAEVTAVMLANGATGHAYDPIIASGINACVLHYIKNSAVCADGDLLLMDFGAEYGNYAADLTRTVPVNGRFNDRQKAVYNAVLRVLKQAMASMKPGKDIETYHKEVGTYMEEALVDLGLFSMKDIKQQNPDKPLYKQYFPHGTSHSLGLDVHDVTTQPLVFQPGMVFTCEPGIYIREEGIGIRLENDVVITEDEPVNLMADFPIEVDEIEGLMNG